MMKFINTLTLVGIFVSTSALSQTKLFSELVGPGAVGSVKSG